MSSRIDERLMEAKQRLRRQRKLESILAEAERLASDAERRRAHHRDRLEAEKADVERLEGLSLTGLFYSVLGDKEQRLEKERQERLAAKLKHDEAAQACEDARREVARIRTELDRLGDAKAEFDGVIAEKERLLTEAGNEKTRALLVFSEQLADLESDCKELDEATAAGRAALASLDRVGDSLRSAEGWGTWDMLGGGMMTTAIKHSKIDEAKACAHAAQVDLRRFQEELADAGERLHLSLEIGGFATFADYFFDGLIADWAVQSRLKEASSACASAMARVRTALQQCGSKRAETQRQIDELTRRRTEFIEKA